MPIVFHQSRPILVDHGATLKMSTSSPAALKYIFCNNTTEDAVPERLNNVTTFDDRGHHHALSVPQSFR